MKFYSIQRSLNLKVIGKYPQVESVHNNCHVWDEPKFVQHVNFEKIDFEPICSNAVLHKKSKQTDLIQCVSMGFSPKLLISGKLKTILENNRKSGLQFFNSPIVQNNQLINDYWLLNMYEFNNEYINFERSVAYYNKQANDYSFSYKKDKILLDIKKLTEFMNYIEIAKPKAEVVSIEKLCLFDYIKDDFFALKYVLGQMYFVSENLKKEIEDAGCTGIEFQPVELSFNEWLMPGGEREKIYGKA